MATTVGRPKWLRARDFDPSWLRTHIDSERKTAGLLGEIREAVFGAQDGLISTLAVVLTVAAATHAAFPVLVAGLASALAGVFSMSAGEYMSSKSQREIFDAQIASCAIPADSSSLFTPAPRPSWPARQASVRRP